MKTRKASSTFDNDNPTWVCQDRHFQGDYIQLKVVALGQGGEVVPLQAQRKILAVSNDKEGVRENRCRLMTTLSALDSRIKN